MSTDLPAILDGKPAVTINHDQTNRWPVLTDEDEQAVLRVMRDGNISTHSVILELESDYKNYIGREYALAHCNGTSALMAAFYALDLHPGDEILVPSATFWASVLPMLWLGLVPVFCESEEERFGLDPEDLKKKITPRTKALVVVHLWGLPSKMTEIIAFAKEHNLKIIEDASHAHGAIWRGKKCGALGDISVFSLQGDKLAPGGEGGILLCDDYSYFEKAVCLGDITRIIQLETPAKRFAATSMGIKTRIAPISAAIAKVQLNNLDIRNKIRETNIVYISKALEKMGFDTFLPPPHIKRTYFEYIIRYYPDNISLSLDLLLLALQKEGCMVSAPRYPLLHQQPFFTEGVYKKVLRPNPEIKLPEYSPDSLPKTQSVNKSLLKLPSFPNSDNGILDQYIFAFEKIYQSADKIKKAFS